MMFIKCVIIILSSLAVILPVPILVMSENNVLIWVVRFFIQPYVVLPEFGISVFSGVLKPGMIGRGVI